MSRLQASFRWLCLVLTQSDYLLDRSRSGFFFYHVEQSMNRIDMLCSINGLLILKAGAQSGSYSFAGSRDIMLIKYCFVST